MPIMLIIPMTIYWPKQGSCNKSLKRAIFMIWKQRFKLLLKALGLQQWGWIILLKHCLAASDRS
ncbi:Uncharacterised protein [Mycobacteroides abscessus subsp. abscessus]|nr:Uncharacterised protein [Mycobacteroides abscessus subsp. abscessus]